MLRPPPRSTLFPTRRSSDLDLDERRDEPKRADGERALLAGQAVVRLLDLVAEHETVDGLVLRYKVERSEEHTSELQSRQYLVCRLLLEKKKEEQLSE